MQTTATLAMQPLAISGEQCRDWSQSSAIEWLVTNGSGGFAMGTASGANTRRYHGLLVASLRPPVERMVLLSRVEEEMLCQGESFNLGACQYPGVVSPAGFQLLEEFRLDPFPVWRYRCGAAMLEKKLFLLPGRQAVVIQYRSASRCRLRVRPFLSFRDYHCLRRADPELRRELEQTSRMVGIRPFEGLPALRIHHNASGFVSSGHWYYNNEYREEMERGLDFQEDLYSPGWIDYELEPGATAFLVATAEELPPPDEMTIAAWESEERARQKAIVAQAPPSNSLTEFRARLETAAEQFLVRRNDGSPTIIAGYPWFTDWGRDTMISLSGLLIHRGRLREAEQILAGFLGYLNQGLIPNRFPDSGEQPEYNTADGTLWMFPAAWSLQMAGESEKFLRSVFYPAAKEILEWHRRGTHYGIHVDPEDGLLIAGHEGTQLTWMDAKVGDWVVTPRHGKPVEINALWYNALRMTAWWAERFGEKQYAAFTTAEAERALASFEAKFWNAARGCLYDRLAPEGPDLRLRPNQLFAVSLPFPLMSEEQQRSIVRVVEESLLTPYGLRTLDPGHPEYRPRYQGGPFERDSAYHQGTVWPWLMGPFISARLQASGYDAGTVAACRELLHGFQEELSRGCLGSINEIYDADPPHRPVGAVAQAWSIAELLRVMADL
jgi:predicted glycogen debranching enzyme